MQANTHIRQYLAQFFLKLETFQAWDVEEIKRQFFYSITFVSRKSCRLWDNVEKYCTAGQATNENMAQKHCMLDT
jgi:hypothetical protein